MVHPRQGYATEFPHAELRIIGEIRKFVQPSGGIGGGAITLNGGAQVATADASRQGVTSVNIASANSSGTRAQCSKHLMYKCRKYA